jgi:methyl-accepting chemotaxis protein
MRLSLSQKLSLGPLSVALVTGLFAFGYLLPRIQAAFDDQGRELGAGLPSALASTLTELLAAHQHVAVQTAIDEVATNPSVAYIAVVDPAGEFIALSGTLAATLRERRGELLTDAESHTSILGEMELLSLRAPVREGALGHVYVGFDRSAARAGIQTLTVRFGMVLAGTLAFLGLGGFFLSRRIVAPLLRLTRVAHRIADEGDLSEPIDVESTDEIGELSQAFVSMVGRLKAVLNELQSSTDLMTRSARELSQTAEFQSHMAHRYAAALQETQSTANEIHQTSIVASQKAEAVLLVAARADELGRTGEAAINESLHGFSELRNQVKEIETQISALGQQTRQIGGITEAVKGLADQSHMLALNAAIEAVRSGEHGKGFGVVAREIRALADQSIRATSQVRELLEDVSHAIASTVRITEEGTLRMEEGLTQVRQSGDTLRALSTIVQDSSSSVRQIAQTVSQQTSGIEQIFSAVSELSTLMDDTLRGITATRSSVDSLQDLSEHISEVVRAYRV